MNAMPTPTPPSQDYADTMSWISSWYKSALAAVFGAGTAWGITRAEIKDHARQLGEHKDAIAALREDNLKIQVLLASQPTKDDFHDLSERVGRQLQTGFDAISQIVTARLK